MDATEIKVISPVQMPAIVVSAEVPKQTPPPVVVYYPQPVWVPSTAWCPPGLT